MHTKVNHEAYILFAKQFKPEEVKLIKFYQDWLPQTIIDCHVHCNLDQHVNFISDHAYKHMLSTFPGFSLEKSEECNNLRPASFHRHARDDL